MLALPLCPSLVAVIIAEPATFAVTRPLVLTVATVALSLDQVIVRPDSGLPFASRGVAVSCTVCPTGTLGEAGVTVTEATGTGGALFLAPPLWPSLVPEVVDVASPAAASTPPDF